MVSVAALGFISTRASRSFTIKPVCLRSALRVRPGATAALAAHRAKGERCILCTASWQHIAASARRQLGLDGAVCSVIEVGEDGIDGCGVGVDGRHIRIGVFQLLSAD
jgi:phosphoserine phosphatase